VSGRSERVGHVTRPTSAAGRSVLLVAHTGRAKTIEVACAVARRLMAGNMLVRVLADEAAALGIEGAEVVSATSAGVEDCDVAVVLGGDGTLLRGAELTRSAGIPLLGINLGHVGFLAEAEWDDLESTVEAIIAGAYMVEERLTLDVVVTLNGAVIAEDWALNEASIEKAARQRMIEVVIEIDDRPLSRWGCDGVVVATPTGSTAYAFSAGGPIVWPEVEALLVVPISAHSLFGRSLVAAPTSTVAVELLPSTDISGVVWCDGRRKVELPPGARVEVSRGKPPIRLARLHEGRFTDRLVAKFGLPVAGWRGAAERRRHGETTSDHA
jgi:NAD+ kinase